MMVQAPILALILADVLTLLLLVPAAVFAAEVLRHWDLSSGHARQLRLEKRTFLIGTALGLVFLAQLAVLPLFVHTVDRMALQIVGAMCAVGTLNANAWGFPALWLRILLFFLAAAWLVLHRLDGRAPSYPLTRAKYALLLAIVPLAGAAAAVQLAFFLRLEPDVITSCCGSLFSQGAESVTAHMAGLPALPAMVALYGVLGLVLATGVVYLRWRRGLVLFGGLSALAFPVAIAAVVAFVSLYVYEHPLHHCPFCLLKREYGYVGYALYLPLFGATALGLGLGLAAALARRDGVQQVLAQGAPRLVVTAGAGFALFAALTAWLSWQSNLILLGY
ncbi:membrane protein, putative [Thioalkalivibrio nitratireducens DSM 14787]|uniref:Membrane protein, putative n=1 Tax=Thioalkalivibrio nitratireducens (strain DSM 14787 / UNIQEM 213 / ALEN2) TaxID=1255043 RepID=L0DRH7_THIND|nr:hypothetical protein [Thioalkalivibrio nitratireducens]AGA32194.1 membrane protein, putative [Thioalkalivibrio nitratireducens DSM 14787]